MMTVSDAELLYDRHAPRLYAVALRITGSEDAAAAVLEEAFRALASGAAPTGAGEAWLIRAVRDLSIVRQSRTAAPAVDPMTPTPRSLVEEAFYGGADVSTLARRHRLAETEVRQMLEDGIGALRAQVGGTDR